MCYNSQYDVFVRNLKAEKMKSSVIKDTGIDKIIQEHQLFDVLRSLQKKQVCGGCSNNKKLVAVFREMKSRGLKTAVSGQVIDDCIHSSKFDLYIERDIRRRRVMCKNCYQYKRSFVRAATRFNNSIGKMFATLKVIMV